jgi:hypothetical protein
LARELPPADARRTLPLRADLSIRAGDDCEWLCRAYEAYLEMHKPVSISFEHAWFLLLALARHDEVGIARCTICGGVRVRDLLGKRKLTCANCEAAIDNTAKASPC